MPNTDSLQPDTVSPEQSILTDPLAGEVVTGAASSAGKRAAQANASSGGLARNALFSYGGTFLGAITGLVVTPLLLRHLGSAHYGLWILLLSVVGYLGLLEVGLYVTVAKRVAECLAQDDEARLRQVLGTAFVLYAGLGLFALLISGILTVFVGEIFHLNVTAIAVARWSLLILGLNQFLVFVTRLQPSILFGAGRLDILTGASSLINLLIAVVNVGLVMCGYGVTALTVCAAVTTVLSGLLIYRLMKRHLSHIEIHPRYASREMARELIKFGSRNATLSIAGTIAFGADALVIGLLLPVSNVAHYAIAAKLVNLVKDLCQKPVDVLLPAYSHAQATKDIARQFQLWTESISLSMVICLPFVVAIWAFGPGLLHAWVGPGHEASYRISVVLGMMILLQLPGHASFMILTGTERNVFLVRIYLVAAVANLVLSLLLTHKYGPIGVALGSLLTVLVVDFVILPWHVCREFGFGYSSYVSQSLAPLAPPAIAGLLLVAGAKYAGMPQGAFLTLFFSGLVVLVSWCAWGMLGIDSDRRGSYLRTARAALNKFAPSAS